MSDDPDVYQDAIDVWGEVLQVDVAIEELSELTTELAREQRGTGDEEEIVDELADVVIMCEQLAIIYGEEELRRRRDEKVERLRERIEAAGGDA